ncbi:MAG: hypothetical protein K5872_07885 [Rhizobiaceae bacterium]|nr:hypothetical protein [Rhizobiaceae bacterium]MCV0406133.1 hypothetical protein [Rhizobiaceae bacterium]
MRTPTAPTGSMPVPVVVPVTATATAMVDLGHFRFGSGEFFENAAVRLHDRRFGGTGANRLRDRQGAGDAEQAAQEQSSIHGIISVSWVPRDQ